MPNPAMLFQAGDLRRSLQQQAAGVINEVESVPEEHVMQADAEAWSKALAARYAIEAPRLLTDDIWRDAAKPIQVDVSRDPRRFVRDRSRRADVPGHRITVHIPFSGEKDVFRLRPSSFTFNPPRAKVADAELRLIIEYPDDHPADIDSEVGVLLREVDPYLTAARGDVDSYNASLHDVAMGAIERRRQRIEQHEARLQSSTIPVGPPRSQSKAYVTDAIVRLPAPTLPQPGNDQPMELEPVLADEVYEHILSVIRQQALSMEKNPKTYAGMGEEDRRHVILDAHNTHYAGAGTAEGFNFGGKTDIIIRRDGRNLFIGECKFWSGPKGFTATLDQLFSYQAWRDTKLAVLMFVRERGLTDIVQKGRETLAENPQFVAWGPAASETELRATVSWQGDTRRRADLTVFFISTPTES
jgi:hypothetical protein